MSLGSIVRDEAGQEWEIGAIALTGGERYYFLVERTREKNPIVSMMPWFMAEEFEEISL